MTTIPDVDVQSALNDALYDAFPDDPVAWENTKYEPMTGTLYLRVWLLPAEPEVVTLGQLPWLERMGVFQVSVFAPIKTGFMAAKAKAAAIVAAFGANTSFVYNGLEVIIDKAWPSSAMVEDGWYHVPVNIRYRCHYQG